MHRACPYPDLPMKRLTFLILALLTSLSLASLQEIPIKDIEGKDTNLKAYDGKVLLIVNVASQCGNTPQYKALQALQEKYAAQGFTVLAFPCNDFGAQEPGTAEEIKTFCSTKYNVTFPLFEKIHVKGEEQHKLYKALTGERSAFPGDVKWNFGKFLIGRNGKPVARFEPGTVPDDAALTKAIEEALAKKP
jgi:glutathione peroxidase